MVSPPLSNGYHHPTITFVCRGTLLAFTFDDNSWVEERPNYQLICLCTYVLFGEFWDVHNSLSLSKKIYIYISSQRDTFIDTYFFICIKTNRCIDTYIHIFLCIYIRTCIFYTYAQPGLQIKQVCLVEMGWSRLFLRKLIWKGSTPLKNNISPDNWWLEDEISF